MIAEGLHAEGGPAVRIAGVLSEEALILLAAFAALGFLILGVLNLIWPTRSRHPVRHRAPAAPRAARPHRQGALARHAKDRGRPYVQPQPLAPSPVPLAPLSPALVTPLATADIVEATAPAQPIAAEPSEPELAPSTLETVPASLEAALPSPAESVPLETLELPSEDESVVEVCFAFYQEQRYADVIKGLYRD